MSFIVTAGFWNMDGWPTPSEWAAFWTAATFVVAFVAALAAFSQLRVILEEREERERPYLSVDFEFRSMLVLIAIENISAKLATTVTLKSVPLPPTTRDERFGKLEAVFSGEFVIPQMAPGRRIAWHIDTASNLFDDDALNRRFEVTARYSDPLARRVGWFGFRSSRPEPRQYEDRFVLDLNQYGHAAVDQDYDNKNWNIAKRNEREIKRIADSAEKLFHVNSERLRIQAEADVRDQRQGADTAWVRSDIRRRRVIGRPRHRWATK